jgi:fatty acid-binding protein DegV
VDIDDKQFYSTIDVSDNVSTACASPNEFAKVYTKMSKNFDEVIFIPLSEPLSSHNQTAIKAAENFKNIHVLRSRCVGYGIIKILEQATELAKKGVGINAIIKRLNIAIPKMQGMILPETMD